MSEWHSVAIGDLGRVVTGATPRTGDSASWGSYIDFITPTEMDYSRRDPYPGRKLSSHGVALLGNRVLPAGSILFACIGFSTGKVALTAAPAVTNQQVNSLIPNPNVVDSHFAYYLLCYHAREIRRIANGSTTPIVNKSTFEAFKVEIPSLSYQRSIADVLGVLDDKIACNHSLIAYSDALARTIFAHAVSRYGEDEQQQHHLGDLVEHLSGKYITREQYAEGGRYTVYGSNSVMGSHSDYLYEGPFTVMARIGSNCGTLTWSEHSAWVNNNASALRAKPGTDPWFIHRLLETVEMGQHRGGSGQPFIRVDSLLATHVAVPSLHEQERVGGALRALAERAQAADAEARVLASVRDTLLPSLILGAIRVRDAEKVVEDAT